MLGGSTTEIRKINSEFERKLKRLVDISDISDSSSDLRKKPSFYEMAAFCATMKVHHLTISGTSDVLGKPASFFLHVYDFLYSDQIKPFENHINILVFEKEKELRGGEPDTFSSYKLANSTFKAIDVEKCFQKANLKNS